MNNVLTDQNTSPLKTHGPATVFFDIHHEALDTVPPGVTARAPENL